MLKCQFCDRELKNQGAKNLHERACEKNPQNNEENKSKKNVSRETYKKECDHEMKVLNEKIKSQKKAMIDGYTIFCKKCGELE